MPGDRGQEWEEYRGFAIAPHGNQWEATHKNHIRRFFQTKKQAKRWIDRRVDHGPNRRGIVRRAIDALIRNKPPDDWRRFPDSQR